MIIVYELGISFLTRQKEMLNWSQLGISVNVLSMGCTIHYIELYPMYSHQITIFMRKIMINQGMSGHPRHPIFRETHKNDPWNVGFFQPTRDGRRTKEIGRSSTNSEYDISMWKKYKSATWHKAIWRWFNLLNIIPVGVIYHFVYPHTYMCSRRFLTSIQPRIEQLWRMLGVGQPKAFHPSG